ncbi:MAG: hypothetical protein ACR2PY_00710 [Salinispira sp.]
MKISFKNISGKILILAALIIPPIILLNACDIATAVAPAPPVYDAANADGYDADGYDVDDHNADGYDADGYDIDGYNIAGNHRLNFTNLIASGKHDPLWYLVRRYNPVGR